MAGDHDPLRRSQLVDQARIGGASIRSGAIQIAVAVESDAGVRVESWTISKLVDQSLAPRPLRA